MGVSTRLRVRRLKTRFSGDSSGKKVKVLESHWNRCSVFLWTLQAADVSLKLEQSACGHPKARMNRRGAES